MINKTIKRRFEDWIRNNNFLDKYNRIELLKFYLEFISDLSVQEKIAISKYYRETGENIFNYSKEKLTEIKDLYSVQRKASIGEGVRRFNTSFSKEEWQNYQNKRVEKIRESRIGKVKESLEYLTLSNSDLLKVSYQKSIIKKGIKVAENLGLDLSSLSEKDLLKLSGYSKSKNYKSLSLSERKDKKIKWMKSNLKNNIVRDIIISDRPDFIKVNIDSLLEEEIEEWYSEYKSILNTKRFIETPWNLYSNCKRGWYKSIKQGKDLFYRSGLELEVYKKLELLEDVTLYESEPFSIKYRKDNKLRRYIPDLLCIYRGKKVIVEVKPEYRVEEFWLEKGQYIEEIKESKFIIITEKTIKNDKIEELFRNDFSN